MKNIKYCHICNSSDHVVNTKIGLLCKKHSLQFYRHGIILNRTIYDKNEYIEKETHYEIILFERCGNESGRAKIDKDDYHTVCKYKWCKNKDGYVISGSKKPFVYLHRLVMNCNEDIFIDHIYGDKMDNRKSMLRYVNNAENLQNRVNIQSNNKTGITGVIFEKRRGKYRVEIQVNKNKIFGGYFDDIISAKTKREELENKHFKHKQYEINKSKI